MYHETTIAKQHNGTRVECTSTFWTVGGLRRRPIERMDLAGMNASAAGRARPLLKLPVGPHFLQFPRFQLRTGTFAGC